MFFTNLAHANEIHTCYDCADYTRTVPGLWSIMSALLCANVRLKKFGGISKGQLTFLNSFLSLNVALLFLTAVSDK